MKYVLVATLSVLHFVIAQAQSGTPRLSFARTVFSFGPVQEAAGTVQARFPFKNMGPAAVKLVTVSASCGCTTPEWPKGTIGPGDTGSILATFNPLGRVGAFKKDITVIADLDPDNPASKNETHILTISGQVIEKVRTAAEIYPDTLGPWVRLQSAMLNLGQADPTVPGAVLRQFTLHNAHNKRIAITFYPANADGTKKARRWPKYLRIEAPPSIDAHQSAVIKVYLEAARRNDYGYLTDYARVEVSDGETTYQKPVFMQVEQRPLPLNTTIIALRDGPKLHLKMPKVLEYGQKLTSGTEIEVESKILKNEGKQPLIVYAAKGTGPFQPKVKRQTIAPDDSGQFGYKLDLRGVTGPQELPLRIYSNDPSEPILEIMLKADVQPVAPKK